MSEQLESVQGNLPAAQARWLRSKAELHGCSISQELRRIVHMAITVESLVGTQPADVHYVTFSAPAEQVSA